LAMASHWPKRSDPAAIRNLKSSNLLINI
jgi:hypothetical protein